MPEAIDWIVSQPDGMGNRSYTLMLPDQPVIVHGGSEDRVYRRTWRVPFPNNDRTYITEVSSFIGFDPGDVGEADVELETYGGYRFYLRSMHKETDGIFDAWDTKDVLVSDEGMVVTLVARCNGTQQGEWCTRKGELSIRAHFGVVVRSG